MLGHLILLFKSWFIVMDTKDEIATVHRHGDALKMKF